MALRSASLLDLKAGAKPYKASDTKGLYLLVQPNGARYWRFRFRWQGVQNTLSCGIYPDVSLEEARGRRDAFRKLLSEGINPSEHAKSERAARADESARQAALMRFLLDNDGALSLCLGNRRVALSPAETAELRAFLDSTRAVLPKV